MNAEGSLRKMQALPGDPVKYFLDLDNSGEAISMNDLTGHKLKIEYTGRIHCIKCGMPTKKSYAQGYCYPCFISAPETEECVLRPELCQAHHGIARDMNYARGHCLIDHFVYLAFSGGLKVGVTRHTQVPTRWIDQGAGRAIIVAKTPNRYQAGTIEVALKNFFRDKTNWRRMLMNTGDSLFDLKQEKQNALSFLHPDHRLFIYPDDSIEEITYPVLTYPAKVNAVNLDKNPVIEDVLTGIRGQYLMFKSGSVLNIRKFGGYHVKMDW